MGRMLIVVALALGLAGELFAQGYPVRPIRWIVGFPPGAATDAASRVVATEMAARLGQPILVENRAGAGGSIGVEQLARAIPDGYTIGTGTSGAITVNPHLSEKAAFDPLRDLAAVAKIVAVPVVVVAASSAPFNSVAELIAAARARPQSISFASPGTYSLMHLAGELFKAQAGVQLTHVPYKGGAPAATDLVAGHIPLGFVDLSAVYGHIKAGKLKALGVTSARRTTIAPEIPTVAEGGLPGLDAAAWAGLFVPAGTPAAIVARLNSEVEEILKRADVRERLIAQGVEPAYEPTDRFAESAAGDSRRWGGIIRGLKGAMK